MLAMPTREFEEYYHQLQVIKRLLDERNDLGDPLLAELINLIDQMPVDKYLKAPLLTERNKFGAAAAFFGLLATWSLAVYLHASPSEKQPFWLIRSPIITAGLSCVATPIIDYCYQRRVVNSSQYVSLLFMGGFSTVLLALMIYSVVNPNFLGAQYGALLLIGLVAGFICVATSLAACNKQRNLKLAEQENNINYKDAPVSALLSSHTGMFRSLCRDYPTLSGSECAYIGELQDKFKDLQTEQKRQDGILASECQELINMVGGNNDGQQAQLSADSKLVPRDFKDSADKFFAKTKKMKIESSEDQPLMVKNAGQRKFSAFERL